MQISWQLLPWQIECWQDTSRFKVIAAGRRCGKSNLAIKMLLAKSRTWLAWMALTSLRS